MRLQTLGPPCRQRKNGKYLRLNLIRWKIRKGRKILWGTWGRTDHVTTVTGLATLPDGRPAVDFKIGGWGGSIISDSCCDDLLFEASTDEQGRFTLSLFYPHLYWLSITDPNDVYTAYDQHFELTEPPEPDAVRFQLQKGVPVEGVVIDRDKNEPILLAAIFVGSCVVGVNGQDSETYS